MPTRRTLARFLAQAQAAVRLRGEVNVLLTSDESIRRLNRRFRGNNKPTDVLSFPADTTAPGPEKIAGELAISVPAARRQAAGQGHSLSIEIKVLMLHGLLHLAGYDHETDTGQMARRERAAAHALSTAPGPDRTHGESKAAALTQNWRKFKLRREPPSMTPLVVVMLVLLAAVVTLASYINRVYSEFGKILAREVQENLDAWEELIEPQIGLSREHAALCAAVLQQLALGIIALEFGAVLFDRAPHLGPPTYAEIFQAVLGVVLVVVFCNQLLPSFLFNRTRGRWVARIIWPVRLLLWLVTPITVFMRFFFSVAALAEEPVSAEEETAVDVEALLEAGEEEGILEESDRDLVRSAVEFGDKLVREVMTPRPSVFAVSGAITLEQFLVELREQNFSRVPVFSGSLDNVTGIAFAHDLLADRR